MTNRDPEFQKRYEELMRGAGARRKKLAARAIANERRYQHKRKRLKSLRTIAERNARVERDLRRDAENLHIARLIEREIAALELKRDAATDSEERFLLKAEIRHLYALKTSLNRKFPKRRPPEAGIAVPVVPPKGPLPKQGGAAAPLDFDG